MLIVSHVLLLLIPCPSTSTSILIHHHAGDTSSRSFEATKQRP
jgi:hypothetical protein